ncbi:MAG: hypothetical protein NVS2B3_12800 [Vulcanimicrobiaceae bacterium]
MIGLVTLATFARAGRDAYAIVNSRRRGSTGTWPLHNGLFDVIDLPPDASDDEARTARAALAGRTALVIDERETRADAAAQRLATLGAAAATLEDGLLGWTQALVHEGTTTHGECRVASFVRPARMVRSYIVVTPHGATIVDGSGSASSLLERCAALAGIPAAVVDTAYHRDRISCGAECAARAEAPYYVPSAGEDRIEARLRLRIDRRREFAGLVATPDADGRNLRLDAVGFSVGAHAGATYRTCCGPEAPGSKTYDAVNRGLALVDSGRRWQLEFGPPGCLPA